jgi:hypothetical protein
MQRGVQKMNRKWMVCLFIAGACAIAFAQDQIDLKGTWSMTIEGPQGPVPVTLTFATVEGQKVTGTLDLPQGTVNILGTFSESGITFLGSLEVNNQSITLKFTGKIVKDSMSGDADFGGFGAGTWSAKKSK